MRFFFSNDHFSEMHEWCLSLQEKICTAFCQIERIAGSDADFSITNWDSEMCDKGKMMLMKGKIFEKVGVNTSCVSGIVPESLGGSSNFGLKTGDKFSATGLSLVAHMSSPFVPAFHMNTRIFISDNANGWFGGCADMNPIFKNKEDTEFFHSEFKKACDKYCSDAYEKFSKECDEYFYIKHRKENRGVGGIFFDYLNSGNYEKDFELIKSIGTTFLDVVPKIVKKRMNETWTQEDRKEQLLKRGRYAEFNLIYDRGTKFGLASGANADAILMSLPPEAAW